MATVKTFWVRDRNAHFMHQPERRGVEGKPHLMGAPVVTRDAAQMHSV